MEKCIRHRNLKRFFRITNTHYQNYWNTLQSESIRFKRLYFVQDTLKTVIYPRLRVSCVYQ